eukprot:4593919-Amphidinium_carterae.1
MQAVDMRVVQRELWAAPRRDREQKKQQLCRVVSVGQSPVLGFHSMLVLETAQCSTFTPRPKLSPACGARTKCTHTTTHQELLKAQLKFQKLQLVLRTTEHRTACSPERTSNTSIKCPWGCSAQTLQVCSSFGLQNVALTPPDSHCQFEDVCID